MTWTHNYLLCKQKLNQWAKQAKWFNCVVGTYLYGAIDCMFLLCHIAMQSESTLCNCLNLKELFYRKRVYIHSNHKFDRIITHRQLHHADKYSQHRSNIWSFWLNGWVILYKLMIICNRNNIHTKIIKFTKSEWNFNEISDKVHFLNINLILLASRKHGEIKYQR